MSKYELLSIVISLAAICISLYVFRTTYSIEQYKKIREDKIAREEQYKELISLLSDIKKYLHFCLQPMASTLNDILRQMGMAFDKYGHVEKGEKHLRHSFLELYEHISKHYKVQLEFQTACHLVDSLYCLKSLEDSVNERIRDQADSTHDEKRLFIYLYRIRNLFIRTKKSTVPIFDAEPSVIVNVKYLQKALHNRNKKELFGQIISLVDKFKKQRIEIDPKIVEILTRMADYKSRDDFREFKLDQVPRHKEIFLVYKNFMEIIRKMTFLDIDHSLCELEQYVISYGVYIAVQLDLALAICNSLYDSNYFEIEYSGGR